LAEYKIHERRSLLLPGKCRNGRGAVPDLLDGAGASEWHACAAARAQAVTLLAGRKSRVYASTLEGASRDLAHGPGWANGTGGR
jgi:hypothetical protein